MTKIITVRIEKELADTLTLMAKKSQRSKSGFIRWLICQASQEYPPEEITNLASVPSDMTKEVIQADSRLREKSERKDST